MTCELNFVRQRILTETLNFHPISSGARCGVIRVGESFFERVRSTSTKTRLDFDLRQVIDSVFCARWQSSQSYTIIWSD